MSYRFVRHGWNCSSIPVLLDSCLQTCMTYTIVECTVIKLLMMDRRTVRNMCRFITKYICEISVSSWFYYKEIFGSNFEKCVQAGWTTNGKVSVLQQFECKGRHSA